MSFNNCMRMHSLARRMSFIKNKNHSIISWLKSISDRNSMALEDISHDLKSPNEWRFKY